MPELDCIASSGKLVAPQKRWDADGRVMSGDSKVQQGPYTEKKEPMAALFLIKARLQRSCGDCEGMPDHSI